MVWLLDRGVGGESGNARESARRTELSKPLPSGEASSMRTKPPNSTKRRRPVISATRQRLELRVPRPVEKGRLEDRRIVEARLGGPEARLDAGALAHLPGEATRRRLARPGRGAVDDLPHVEEGGFPERLGADWTERAQDQGRREGEGDPGDLVPLRVVR